MRLIALLGLVALIGAFPWSSFAAEPQVIKWQDLAPAPVQIENPFSKLSQNQLRQLRQILKYEQAVQADKMPVEEAAAFRGEVAAIRAKLEADGLDIELLFAQRKSIMQKRQELATKTNDNLLGKVVRLPGYLLPFDIRDRKAVEFLLVPTVGACIHVPAPPPNQMVHVSYPAGFPFEELYRPIWIVGTLEAETITRDVGLSDGSKQIEVGYTMTAVSVEPYQN